VGKQGVTPELSSRIHQESIKNSSREHQELDKIFVLRIGISL